MKCVEIVLALPLNPSVLAIKQREPSIIQQTLKERHFKPNPLRRTFSFESVLLRTLNYPLRGALISEIVVVVVVF